MINVAQGLNAIAIKNVSLPPSADDFCEDFARFLLVSTSDLFSGSNQYNSVPESPNMTAFMTHFGLLRITTLPEGYTNRVQAFDRVIHKELQDAISGNCGKPFIDGVAVKPFSCNYYVNEKGTLEK